jgi:O-antigen/teichoic acid export membrane protein
MAEFIETVQTWFFSLGDDYGVNPIIFGSIYVGAIPFFTLSIGWLVKNYRNEKSVVLPAIAAIFFFISAYLYLMIAGENVPLWVYGIVILMIIYGAYSTFKNVKKRIKSSSEP